MNLYAADWSYSTYLVIITEFTPPFFWSSCAIRAWDCNKKEKKHDKKRHKIQYNRCIALKDNCYIIIFIFG